MKEINTKMLPREIFDLKGLCFGGQLVFIQVQGSHQSVKAGTIDP
jgi:hypothetical protein